MARAVVLLLVKFSTAHIVTVTIRQIGLSRWANQTVILVGIKLWPFCSFRDPDAWPIRLLAIVSPTAPFPWSTVFSVNTAHVSLVLGGAAVSLAVRCGRGRMTTNTAQGWRHTL